MKRCYRTLSLRLLLVVISVLAVSNIQARPEPDSFITIEGVSYYYGNADFADVAFSDSSRTVEIGGVSNVDAKLAVGNLTVNSGESFEANVNIEFGNSGAIAYSGFQFDVIIPQDITFEDVTLAPQLAGNFTLASKLSANGSVRIIAYSSNSSTTTLDNGIVTLKLKVSQDPDNDTSIIKLNNVYFSTPKGSDIALLDSDFTVDISIVAYSIELNPSEFTLLVGQSQDIKATLSPSNVTDKMITWSSQNDAVAKYENGKIIALSKGTTTITATCGEASATCTVTVKGGSGEGDDSGITVKPGDGTEGGEGGEEGNLGEKTENGGYLDGNDLTLRVGQTAIIEAELDPELTSIPTLEWELATGGSQFVRLTPAANTLSAAFTGLAIGETSYTISIAGNKLVEGKVKVIAEKPIYALQLNPASITMAQNALPTTITPEYIPEQVSVKTLNWSSSDSTVASVDQNGHVTPLKQGETTITATTTDGTDLSSQCQVTVTAPIDDQFEFEFDESVMGGKVEISLYLGDTYQFTPKAQEGYVLPEVIEWSSSDGKTVSVSDKGVITALALGKATITATATVNGKEVKAQCEVTVIPTPAESIAIIVFGSTTLEINQTVQLTAEVLPVNATDKSVIWTSSNKAVAEVTENGLVTALTAGETVITATNSAGQYDRVTITVLSNEPDQPDVPDVPEKRADTPTEMLRKGDGTSHTFVAMMEKSDEVLEAEGYRYVFGYTNTAEGAISLENTPWRYTYTTGDIYWNDSNDFWVFAYYVDNEGTLCVSSRRHLDGSLDDGFDPMDFIGGSTRGGEHIVGIYTVKGKYMGKNIEMLESGIYVVQTSKSSYKIIK